MNTKSLSLVTVFVLLTGAILACTSTPAPTPVPPTPYPTLDVGSVLQNITQVREERIYVMKLKFKKEDLLDPFKNAFDNELTAEHRMVLVGEKTYNQYAVGSEMSRKSDTLGFIFNGDLASYVVSVEEKHIISQYFWQRKDNADTEISKESYDVILNLLAGGTKPTITVPYEGVTVTYILDKPLNQYVFVDKQPLTRYFVTVQVKNETLTLDLTKLLRNANNTHEIDLEVPKAVYDQTGELWDPKISTGSFLFKGNLSTLHGVVLKKWTEVDPNFFVATTKDGETMVVPTKRQ